MSLYHYQPLNKATKQVRLLYFERISHLTDTDIVRCRIKHVTLSELQNAAYIAVSYCWGGDGATVDIEVDGSIARFSRPAEQALRGAFSRTLVSPKLDVNTPVWIDQICINQGDNEERSWQVPLMFEIYSFAQRVHVWLGPANKGTDTAAAIQSIHVMYEECHRLTNGFNNLIRLSQAVPNDGSGVPAEFPRLVNLAALVQFYTAEWFTRIWPVQEVLMAREAIMIQGGHVIPWHTVAVVGRWMTGRLLVLAQQINRDDTLRRLIKDQGAGQGLRNAGSTWDMKVDTSNKSRSPRHVFANTCYLNATDPRDKIWAVHALLRHYGLPDRLLAVINPDYANKLTVSEVYAAATYVVFLSEQSLSFLEMAKPWQALTPPPPSVSAKGVTVGQSPSWSYKFEKVQLQSQNTHGANSQSSSLEFFSNLVQGVFSGVRMQAGFSARLNQSPHTLTVKSLPFGTVTSVGGTIDQGLITRAMAGNDFSAVARELVTTWRPPGLDGSLAWPADTLQQFGTVAVNGLSGFPSNARHAESDPKFTSQFSAFLLNGLASPGSPISPALISQLQAWNPSAGNPREYMSWMAYFGAGKALYTTSTGFLGAGPPSTQPGDKVCFVFGCKVPLIMRKTGDYWQIVGQSYICKVMNGDVTRKIARAGKLQAVMQDFSIL